VTLALLVALTLMPVAQQTARHDAHGQHKAAMDHRGDQAMGFDQAKIRHTFTTTERGGTIEVIAKDPKDSTTITQIRKHLMEIARLFKDGDFSKPIFIHAQNPPGADIMKARRADITYRFDELPAGGRVTITSTSDDAVAATHAFLRFQREQHK